MSEKKDNISKSVAELDKLIEYFESGAETSLDKDLEKYEEAMQLIQNVQKELESFELKINEIKEKYAAEREPEPEQADLFE